MNVFFLDSSALAKRYLREQGSAWITGLLLPAPVGAIRIANVTGVEVVSALIRSRRRGAMTALEATSALQQFRLEYERRYRVLDVSRSIVLHAMALAERHELRAYDAVQLAAAMSMHSSSSGAGISMTFVSADAELNAAAAAEGMAVENPNDHP